MILFVRGGFGGGARAVQNGFFFTVMKVTADYNQG